MLLRIVHPGGRVEVHDRPVTAAEIMYRNPRCCVAHPFVFQQPWAVVEPDTVLMLGQKFYVVPISTIRKLQGLSPRNSPSPAREMTIGSLLDETRNTQSRTAKEDDSMISTCCIFRKKSIAKKSNSFVIAIQQTGRGRQIWQEKEALLREHGLLIIGNQV